MLTSFGACCRICCKQEFCIPICFLVHFDDHKPRDLTCGFKKCQRQRRQTLETHLNMVHVELSTPGLHLQVTKTHALQMCQFLSTANHSGSQHLKGIYWHQRRSFVQWLVSVTLRAISEAQNAKNGTWNCSRKDVVACCSRACCLKHQNSQVFGVASRPTCHHRSHPRQEFELHR